MWWPKRSFAAFVRPLALRDGRQPAICETAVRILIRRDIMTTTRLYVVRHGSTVLTAEDRFSGAIGVDLSDEGRWQAARAGERLRAEGITAIYSSPLSRSVETARIIAEACGLTIETRDGLCEISHGRWEGLTRR